MNVIGIAGMSLDGCITKHYDEGTAFLSAQDEEYFRDALKSFDSSICGSNTFKVSQDSILKALTRDRLRVVLTSQPEKYASCTYPDKLEFKQGDLAAIIAELEQRNRRRCAILGGSRVYTECVQKGLMDELWLTVEPCAFGIGKRLFDELVQVYFSLDNVQYLSKNTLLLKYRITRNTTRSNIRD